METIKWLTKIFIHDDGMQDLIIIETGEVVMSSRNGDRIWDKRMKLEEELREQRPYKRKVERQLELFG